MAQTCLSYDTVSVCLSVARLISLSLSRTAGLTSAGLADWQLGLIITAAVIVLLLIILVVAVVIRRQRSPHKKKAAAASTSAPHTVCHILTA